MQQRHRTWCTQTIGRRRDATCDLSRHAAGLEAHHRHLGTASSAVPKGWPRGTTLNCLRTGFAPQQYRGGPSCDQQRLWRPTTAGLGQPPHATFTQVRIPPTAWLSMWQCSSQRPGLSKTHMTSRLSPAPTKIVSRKSPKAPSSSTS